MKTTNSWQDADRIAERIAALIKQEIQERHVRPSQVFAGQMQALLAHMETAPAGPPASFRLAQVAITECLRDMMEARETWPD